MLYQLYILLKSEQHADIIIPPNTYDSNFKDMKQAVLCIQQGEEAAIEKLAEVKKIWILKKISFKYIRIFYNKQK